MFFVFLLEANKPEGIPEAGKDVTPKPIATPADKR